MYSGRAYRDACAWRADQRGWTFYECVLVRVLAEALRV